MTQTIFYWLNHFDRVFVNILKWLCIVLFSVITVILTLKIIVRYMPFMSMHIFDDILDLLYSSLIFYGAVAVWITRGHFSVGDWISKFLPSIRARFVYRLLVELLSLIFIAVFFWYSLQFMLGADGMMDILPLPKWWMYLCMPISGGMMLIYSLKNMYLELLKIANPATNIDEGAPENLNH